MMFLQRACFALADRCAIIPVDFGAVKYSFRDIKVKLRRNIKWLM